jgi:hypothetical protein
MEYRGQSHVPAVNYHERHRSAAEKIDSERQKADIAEQGGEKERESSAPFLGSGGVAVPVATIAAAEGLQYYPQWPRILR